MKKTLIRYCHAVGLGFAERREPDNPYLTQALSRAYMVGAVVAWRHWPAWSYSGPRDRHPVLARLAKH
jgi:hypothetical protein